MLALGLTITLLSVVYAALELHWRFSTLGQVEVERAQIARAVLTKMSADIRSTMYRSPVDEYADDYTSESEADGDSQSTDEEIDEVLEETVVEVTDPAEAYSGSQTGVFGDSASVTLHIRRPYRQSFDSDDQLLNPLSEGDQKSVSYFLAGSGGTLATMSVGQIQASKQYDDGIDGLARMTGDRFSLSLADQQSDLIQMASQTKLLAEEIDTLSFEYHDGVEWLTEWDSDVMGRLPNAIGITIGFREPDHQPGSILYHQPSESTDTFRIVVPLVVSSPFEGLVY